MSNAGSLNSEQHIGLFVVQHVHLDNTTVDRIDMFARS